MLSNKPNQESRATLPVGTTVKAPTVDKAGLRYGRLLVIRVVGKAKNNSLLWECICDCGNTVVRSSASLRVKQVASCGCYLAETNRKHLKEMGVWNKGKQYSFKEEDEIYKNKKAWSKAVIKLKGKACALCSWDVARCDVHHILPLSNGGENTVDNGIVVCPNCHRILHEGVYIF